MPLTLTHTEVYTVLALSALAALAVTPAVRWLLLRRGLVDEPNARSSHALPTPRGGGVGCALAVVVGISAASMLGRPVAAAIVGCALAIAAVGFIDDRRSLSPRVRLAAQLTVGAAAGGAVLGTSTGPLVGALLVAGVVNVTNFMDGINGISAATVMVWGATAAAVGQRQAYPELTTLGLATAGAAVGFLPWNAPRAHIFLGDVGSYLFGALMAGGILVAWLTDPSAALVVAAPLSVYLADTSYTLWRRWRRGAPLTQAHREHVYQRLVNPGGLSHVASTAVAVSVAAAVTAAFAWSTFMGVTAAALGLSFYLAAPRLVRSVRGVPHVG